MGRKRCRTCRVDGIHKLALKEFPELHPMEACKFGHLYRCSRCSSFWFAHDNGPFANRLHDDWLPLARHWNQNRLTVDGSILQALAGIGGIASYDRGTIEIACRVRNSSEQVHERAIVSISQKPPYASYRPESVHWANEILEIAPSAFALPLDVRQASAAKPEIAQGFAPVAVEDAHGRRYRLGRETAFFDFKGVRGPELTLSSDQSDCQPGGKVTIEYGVGAKLSKRVFYKTLSLVTGRKQAQTVWPTEREAVYFIDWFEGCEDLLMQYQVAAAHAL